MRIALVSSEYPPFRGGGIGTYAHLLSAELARQGHDVHVVANGWGEEADPVPGVTVHRVHAFDRSYSPQPPFDDESHLLGALVRRHSLSLLWSSLACVTLDALHRSEPLDIAEFPECFGEGYVALRCRAGGVRFSGLPMTVTLHSPMDDVAAFNELPPRASWVEATRRMENTSVALADGITSPSALVLQAVLGRVAVTCHAKQVIPNPLPIPSGVSSCTDRGAPTLLFVGRLEPRKGLPFLARLWNLLAPRNPSLRMMLVGGDSHAGSRGSSMKQAFLTLSDSACAERVSFQDSVPRSQLSAYFQRAALCIFPAPWDNFPYAALEALANRACVVASRRSGLRELIEDGNSGVLLEADDPTDWVEPLEALLSNPERRREMGRRGQARVQSYCDPASVVGQRVDHYAQVIAARRQVSVRPRSRVRRIGTSMERIAIGIVCDGACDALEATCASVVAAADRESIQVSFIGTDGCSGLAQPAGGRSHLHFASQADFETHVLGSEDGAWLTLRAGDVLGNDYLDVALAILDEDPSVAWATTWLLPVDSTLDEPYAALDFSVEFDLAHYQAAPFVLARTDALRRVGGLAADLPPAWRLWDFFLSCATHRLRGVVVPDWCGRFVSHIARDLRLPDTRRASEDLLEKITGRHASLYREQGGELWIRGVLDGFSPPSVGLSRLSGAGEPVAFDLLANFDSAIVDAPATYVALDYSFSANRPVLVAHPPASVCFEADPTLASYLEFAIALHPSVVDQARGGVQFSIRVDGAEVFRRNLEPASCLADRGVTEYCVDLRRALRGPCKIEFRTDATDPTKQDFLSAVWGSPTLVSRPSRTASSEGVA